MKQSTSLGILLCLTFLVSCADRDNDYDASGSFEAEETVIAAEAMGAIQQFKLEEGQELKPGDTIGYIDSIPLHLKKKQLEAQIVALLGKRPQVSVQLASLREQLKAAEREKVRMEKLVAGDAATPKQLDNVNDQVTVLKRQLAAQQSALSISSTGLDKDAVALEYQLEQIEDQLDKCLIINPVEGTVLNKYAQPHETASIGKPLYKIADLNAIYLKAYVSGNQLAQLKLGQQVQVLTDDGKDGFKQTQGSITWISDKAEFTPKTIRTKDERADMVYGIKVAIQNDGTYKIGMYGELKF